MKATKEMEPADPPGPAPFRRVLWDELLHLGRRPAGEEAPETAEIFRRIGGLRDRTGRALSALCFSGGGIRSATFNLGVIQALAKMGLLGRFDYLSSVSGGGYIAGWLKAWLHRRPLEEVTRDLVAPALRERFDPLEPEPAPLRHLRDYSNYLTPRLGLFSADTWTAAALVVRNLLLNWLVLLPALAAFVGIPQASLIVASGATNSFQWGVGGLTAALLLALWASASVYHFRIQRREPADERRIVLLGVVPLWFASLTLALTGLWFAPSYGGPRFALFCAVWCVAIPLAGWVVARMTARGNDWRQPALADVLGLVVSGAVAASILYGIAASWLPWLKERPAAFVILAVPILLGLYLLARALFVAFASLGEKDVPTPAGATPAQEIAQADREWWARLSGWVLILAIAWMAGSALVILGGPYLEKLIGFAGISGAGGLSGLLTALLGASRKTAGRRPDTPSQENSPVKEILLRLAAPLTAGLIVIALAHCNSLAAQALTGMKEILSLESLSRLPELHVKGTLLRLVLTFLLVPFAFASVSWLLGWVVNVNRFSAQGLYRNRLMRAYLGASNTGRNPDPFTGFDPADNLRLHQLAKGETPRPLTVINVTLNLVGGADRLAWQQRKAQSFSMTPLYCGNFQEGYRRSEEYGGADGITLGTAMTISGAAANPSAGYHSSPFVSFLLTLFNVRLGSWLGNPNEAGEKVFGCSGPRHAWKPLFADLFGLTDCRHPYVSLSDGGHFENLGVYEMILRRCRLIVASDAGADAPHSFEDLGGLVRKARIDFGIPIEFKQPVRLLPRAASGEGMLCALGTIHYDRVDGEGAEPGLLLYLKPTLHAEGQPLPQDVLSYSRASAEFPHESTADQWFTEAQFESYRALGFHLASQLGGGGPFEELQDLFDAVEGSLSDSSEARGETRGGTGLGV